VTLDPLPVRRAGNLLQASFRFHLAMNTLASNYQGAFGTYILIIVAHVGRNRTRWSGQASPGWITFCYIIYILVTENSVKIIKHYVYQNFFAVI